MSWSALLTPSFDHRQDRKVLSCTKMSYICSIWSNVIACNADISHHCWNMQNVVCLVSCSNSSGSLPPSMWLYWVYLCRGHSKVYAGTNFIAVSQPPRILILDPYSRYISTYCVVIMVNNWHA